MRHAPPSPLGTRLVGVVLTRFEPLAAAVRNSPNDGPHGVLIRIESAISTPVNPPSAGTWSTSPRLINGAGQVHPEPPRQNGGSSCRIRRTSATYADAAKVPENLLLLVSELDSASQQALKLVLGDREHVGQQSGPLLVSLNTCPRQTSAPPVLRRRGKHEGSARRPLSWTGVSPGKRSRATTASACATGSNPGLSGKLPPVWRRRAFAVDVSSRPRISSARTLRSSAIH